MILFFANSLDFTNPARILGIFPEPARSHFIFNRQIMYSLLEAGHHITFVSPFQEPNPPINFTYIVPMRTKETASEDLARTDFKSLSAFQADRLWSQYHFSFWSDLMKSREIQVSHLAQRNDENLTKCRSTVISSRFLKINKPK